MTCKAEQRHPASIYGSDRQYRDWLSYQPSCVSGGFNQVLNGAGRNIACHVRRASNAGTGYKPPFSAVPMTDVEHMLQHNRGEAAVLLAYGKGHFTTQQAKEWFNEQARKYLERWIAHRSNPKEFKA